MSVFTDESQTAQKCVVLVYTSLFSSTGGGQFAMTILAKRLHGGKYDFVFFTNQPFNPEHRYAKMLRQSDIPIEIFPNLDYTKFQKIGLFLWRLLFTLPYLILKRLSLTNAWIISGALFQRMVALHRKKTISNILKRHADKYQSEGGSAILHIWGPSGLAPSLFAWGKQEEIPTIYHEMGEADETYVKTWGLEETVATVNQVDYLICSSELVAQNVRRVYAYEGKIEKIPFMVEDPGENWRAATKRDGRLTFGAIGRLVPHKRHRELIEAISRLTNEGYDVGLLIAGSGPERANLEKQVAESNLNDRVIFTGEFESLREIMTLFDVFTLTSSSESQCMPIIESMAYGKAVVVSRFGGMPDFVEEGVTGFLIPLEDIDELVESMRRLMNDPELRVRMGDMGRKRYERLYTPGQIARTVERVYEELLQQAPEARTEQMWKQSQAPVSTPS
jgi:glycosyltransferase involved in cell wall biosynthesis